AVHGGLGQSARERALRAFRNGKVDVLVATDVAARGLDVAGVTHVINYDCPEDPDTYTHRIGRTGRAGATGIAITFVDWEDMARWRLIDKTLSLGIGEPPETYHTSPWLYTDLDIPTDVSGELPHAQRSRAGLAAEAEEDLGGRSRSGGRRSRRAGGAGGSATAESSSPTRRRRRRRRLTSEPRGAGERDGAPAAVGGGASTAVEAPADRPRRTRRRRRRGGAGESGGGGSADGGGDGGGAHHDGPRRAGGVLVRRAPGSGWDSRWLGLPALAGGHGMGRLAVRRLALRPLHPHQ